MMNKILVGIFTGLTVGYIIGKFQEKKFFDSIYRNVHTFRLKTKSDNENGLNKE